MSVRRGSTGTSVGKSGGHEAPFRGNSGCPGWSEPLYLLPECPSTDKKVGEPTTNAPVAPHLDSRAVAEPAIPFRPHALDCPRPSHWRSALSACPLQSRGRRQKVGPEPPPSQCSRAGGDGFRQRWLWVASAVRFAVGLAQHARPVVSSRCSARRPSLVLETEWRATPVARSPFRFGRWTPARPGRHWGRC
jgi:hypothetical protein